VEQWRLVPRSLWAVRLRLGLGLRLRLEITFGLGLMFELRLCSELKEFGT
jgi:hypothetical protein